MKNVFTLFFSIIWYEKYLEKQIIKLRFLCPDIELTK